MIAEFITNIGKFKVQLFASKVPKIVDNFVGLAEGTREFIDPESGQSVARPYYNGLIFHRIIDNFMIQGGCPVGNGTGGPGYQFEDEFHPDLVHSKEGILSMANAGPDTNGSQFFITLGPTPHLDNRHSVFGEVVEGIEVIREIGNTRTGMHDRPLHDIVIESVEIIKPNPS